jgi:hypothetical protein
MHIHPFANFTGCSAKRESLSLRLFSTPIGEHSSRSRGRNKSRIATVNLLPPAGAGSANAFSSCLAAGRLNFGISCCSSVDGHDWIWGRALSCVHALRPPQLAASFISNQGRYRLLAVATNLGAVTSWSLPAAQGTSDGASGGSSLSRLTRADSESRDLKQKDWHAAVCPISVQMIFD